MAYGKSKDSTKRTKSYKVLRSKAFKIVRDLVEVVLLLNQVINLQMNFIGRSLENVRNKKFIHLLETIFGV